MATLNSASVKSDSFDDAALGRVGFLMTRPDITVVYTERRDPGSVFAYYNPSNGFAELYVVDPSGYKFMALG